jgi:hypothetical protein
MSRWQLSRRAALPAVLATAAVVVSTPGGAVTSAAAASRVAGHTQQAHRHSGCLAGGRGAGVLAARGTRAPDQDSFTQAQLLRLQKQLDSILAAKQGGATTSERVAPTIRIALRVHIIDGTTQRGPNRPAVKRQIAVLNKAYDGGQSPNNVPTRFRFYLGSFNRVTNNAWRTAAPGSATDDAMRRALHVGGRRDLNLYFAKPEDPTLQGAVLGFSSLPWDVKKHPKLDGVTIRQGTQPGGGIKHYNLGDTAVHEIGHWLGLLHTFQGGCTEPNDMVKDTPEEATPSSTCDTTKDTCPAPGLDPVHNFMDYAVDSCMDMFTKGQVTRMTDEWLAYRSP